MVKVSKKTKLISWFVLLTFSFLCCFNIVYSYFSTTAKIIGAGSMNSVDVSYIYISDGSSKAVSTSTTLQLFLENESIGRGDISALKVESTAASGYSTATNIGFRIGGNSCNVYIRFWVEAYKMAEIKGNNYYIDSKNNYVDEDGNYVDEQGNSIVVAEENQGDVIDYGQYFELGEIKNEEYGLNSNVYKRTSTYNNNQYVTYFYTRQLQTTDVNVYLFNTLKWLETTPNEVMGSTMSLFVSFEAVQKDYNAYLSAFNDYRGYYSW